MLLLVTRSDDSVFLKFTDRILRLKASSESSAAKWTSAISKQRDTAKAIVIEEEPLGASKRSASAK